MNASTETFTVRTGRATVLIGPPAALNAAGGSFLPDGSEDAALHIELALDACRDTGDLRQFCNRWGLDTQNLFYVDDSAFRRWLARAARQGEIEVRLLPDALVTGSGAVQARLTQTKARVSARFEQVLRKPGAGMDRQPGKLIEAVQSEQRGKAPGAGAATSPPLAVLTPEDIQAMELEDRFLEVMKRAVDSDLLSGEVKAQLKVLLDPQTLAVIIGVLVGWAASHAIGVGFVVDIALLAFGVFALGTSAVEAAQKIAEFLTTTKNARTSADLDIAAALLAAAIALIGVAMFIRLITRGAAAPAGMGKKTGGGLKTRNKGSGGTFTPPRRLEKRPSPEADAQPKVKADLRTQPPRQEHGTPRTGTAKPAPSRINFRELPASEQRNIDETMGHITGGTNPPKKIKQNWGREFENRADDLPDLGPKGYKEYRVRPAPGESNAYRLVIGRDGNIYYTWTHYGDAGHPAFVNVGSLTPEQLSRIFPR